MIAMIVRQDFRFVYNYSETERVVDFELDFLIASLESVDGKSTRSSIYYQ